MELEGIDHVAIDVQDVDGAVRWYVDVLGFERQHQGKWDGVPVFVGKGTTAIAIFPRAHSDPVHNGNIRHIAFRADRKNFLAAQQELKKRGIEFEFEDHEISHSIYFCDPEDHKLEITTYELAE